MAKKYSYEELQKLYSACVEQNKGLNEDLDGALAKISDIKGGVYANLDLDIDTLNDDKLIHENTDHIVHLSAIEADINQQYPNFLATYFGYGKVIGAIEQCEKIKSQYDQVFEEPRKDAPEETDLGSPLSETSEF